MTRHPRYVPCKGCGEYAVTTGDLCRECAKRETLIGVVIACVMALAFIVLVVMWRAE